MIGVAQISAVDRPNAAAFLITPPPLSSPSPTRALHLAFQLTRRHRGLKSNRRITSSSSSHHRRPTNHHVDDYIEASLLLSETVSHHRMRMRKRGFDEETNWNSTAKLRPFSRQATRQRSVFDSELMRKFQSPTVFLKVSCDGDFLLPIVVGEYAIENLINGHRGDDNEDCPDQFQLVENLVEKLDHQVHMVSITEKVLNTYFAKLHFSKLGESDILTVNAQPSDAISIAHRCKAPIYVNKEIVLRDALRISYGLGRMREMRPAYDVSLDSAADGPNLLAQELVLVKNINLAIKEERYRDAAMWRQELLRLSKLSKGNQC